MIRRFESRSPARSSPHAGTAATAQTLRVRGLIEKVDGVLT